MTKISVAAAIMIEELTEPEAHSVTLHADNPDFNGLPNCVVSVCGDYTEWEEKEFRADTLEDCLAPALAEMKAHQARVIAELEANWQKHREQKAAVE